MEHFFGQGWEITPAGGATGEAFFAQHDKQKLFLKRNSSPFLAVLSAEGIVPKLIWTKRMESGDVITAQKWLKGRELKPQEMNDERVALLLRKIHHSKPLLGMLKRLGKSPLQPDVLLRNLEEEIDDALKTLPSVTNSLQYLYKEVTKINSHEMVVCHCDVNHNNWLLSETDKLYLIDWDGAMIADPAIDLGPLLYSYIERDDWERWLEKYGIKLDEPLQLRMKWYVITQTLQFIQWHKEKQRYEEMDYWINFLEKVLNFTH